MSKIVIELNSEQLNGLVKPLTDRIDELERYTKVLHDQLFKMKDYIDESLKSNKSDSNESQVYNKKRTGYVSTSKTDDLKLLQEATIDEIVEQFNISK